MDDGESEPVSEADQSFLTLHEIVKAAYRKADRNIWDYIVGGTETETTVRRNRLAIDRIAFRPRVLRDVSKLDASGRFFGHPIRLPIVLAPVGGLESIGARGRASTVARAASRFGVPFFLSSVTKIRTRDGRGERRRRPRRSSSSTCAATTPSSTTMSGARSTAATTPSA